MKYAVVICTYNRAESVILAVSCLLKQTVLPSQVVIVDASPDYRAQRSAFLREIQFPDVISFSYLISHKASLAVQRNQGVDALANDIDIVFLVDDDSYMYESCAENLLSIYAADADEKIVGVQASLSGSPPQKASSNVSDVVRKKKSTETPFASWVAAKLKFVWKGLLLMGAEYLFIPYNGRFGMHSANVELPEDCFPVNLFHGCRMTFRRSIFSKERFDSDLVRYSAAEDLDFSYRASCHGALVESRTAWLYHHTAESGRLSRYSSSKMAAYNIALFLYKHSESFTRDRNKYALLFVRRLLAEFIKDTVSRRFSFPQVRGVWSGSLLGLALLRSPRNNRDFIEKNQRHFL